MALYRFEGNGLGFIGSYSWLAAVCMITMVDLRLVLRQSPPIACVRLLYHYSFTRILLSGSLDKSNRDGSHTPIADSRTSSKQRTLFVGPIL